MPEDRLNRRHGNNRVLLQPAPTLDLAEFKQGSFYRDLVVEFVATLLFLYITVATVIGHKQQTGPCGGVGVLGVAWAFGGTYFILVYCIAGVSGTLYDPESRPVMAPLAIGFVVFVVHLATIPGTGTTGISINPAGSLGVAVIYNNRKVWNDLIIFWFGPLVGAFAATVYNVYILGLWYNLIAHRNNPTN